MPGGIEILNTTFSTYKNVQDISSANIARAGTDSPRQQANLVLGSSAGGGVTGLVLSGTSSAFDEQIASFMRTYQTKTAAIQRLNNTNVQVEQRTLGLPGEGTSFIHRMNDMSNAFKTMASDGKSFSALLFAVQQWTQTMASAGNAVQDERLRADADLSTSVSTVNQLLKNIASFNGQIMQASGDTLTTLIDQRRSALHELSAYMGIQIVGRDQNVVDVVSTAQAQLVIGTQSASFVYTPSGAPTAATTYNPVTLQYIGTTGAPVDATDTIEASDGQMASLLRIRDTYLPNIQEQLDIIAQQSAIEFNRLHNMGTSRFAPNTLTGESLPGNAAVTALTGLAGTGTIRVGSLDKTTGEIATHVDINLSTITNVQGVLDAINNAAPALITAAITNGTLVLTSANSAKGIVIGHAATDTSEPTIGFSSGTAYTRGVSRFFGLNNLFSGEHSKPLTGFAQALEVRSDIVSANGYGLAIAYAEHPTTTWTIGNLSSQLASDMSTCFTESSITFPITQEVTTQVVSTIRSYSQAFIDRHVRDFQLTKTNSDNFSNILQSLSEHAYNQSGVDIQREFMLMQQYAQSIDVVISALVLLNRMLSKITESL